jgi:hypothetical protein
MGRARARPWASALAQTGPGASCRAGRPEIISCRAVLGPCFFCVLRASPPSPAQMYSSTPHSGCMVVAQAFGQGVALEASVPDDKILGSADDTELVPAGSLQVAPDGDPTPSHQLISHDLGVPSFFSNLQVLWSILV